MDSATLTADRMVLRLSLSAPTNISTSLCPSLLLRAKVHVIHDQHNHGSDILDWFDGRLDCKYQLKWAADGPSYLQKHHSLVNYLDDVTTLYFVPLLSGGAKRAHGYAGEAEEETKKETPKLLSNHVGFNTKTV